MVDLPASHLLHPGYGHKVLQGWASEHRNVIPKQALVWPLFLLEDDEGRQEIGSMPEQCRWGANRLPEALDQPVRDGLAAVLLFGVIDDPCQKDEIGSAADKQSSPVIKAIKVLKARYPGLLIMCDLCLCGYTSHGHCGILKGKEHDHAVDNAASIERLGQIAAAYAQAGAHVIAPSDMMDGRVAAIKKALTDVGYGSRVAVMSYSAKFASCFYGPFRDAAHSGMAFGDRSFYQLPAGSRSLALRAVQRDIEEGADYVMVKPGGPYLDICRDVANASNVPVAVYQVSGEYAMLWHAATAGAFEMKRAVMESLVAFQRAGVSIIITYFAPRVLTWIKEDNAAVGTVIDS